MTYVEILTTITTVVAVLGYLYERNKRERIELNLAIANTQLGFAQQISKQLNSTSQQINNYIIDKNYSLLPEDTRRISTEMSSVTTATISLSEAIKDSLTIGEVLAYCKSKNLLGVSPLLRKTAFNKNK